MAILAKPWEMSAWDCNCLLAPELQGSQFWWSRFLLTCSLSKPDWQLRWRREWYTSHWGTPSTFSRSMIELALLVYFVPPRKSVKKKIFTKGTNLMNSAWTITVKSSSRNFFPGRPPNKVTKPCIHPGCIVKISRHQRGANEVLFLIFLHEWSFNASTYVYARRQRVIWSSLCSPSSWKLNGNCWWMQLCTICKPIKYIYKWIEYHWTVYIDSVEKRVRFTTNADLERSLSSLENVTWNC